MVDRGRKSSFARCGLSAGDGARSVFFSGRTELDLCERVVCVLFSTLFCKRAEAGKKSFHAVYLKKEKLNVLVLISGGF